MVLSFVCLKNIVIQDICSIAICNHLNSADIWTYCNNWCFEEFKPPKKLLSLLTVEEQYDGISTRLQECPTLGEHHPCLFTLYWKRQMGDTEGQPVVWLLFSPRIDSNMKPSYEWCCYYYFEFCPRNLKTNIPIDIRLWMIYWLKQKLVGKRGKNKGNKYDTITVL